MQGDTAIFIRTGGTIFQISFDWATDCAKLRANLMMTARKQLNLQKKISVGDLN